MARINSKIVKDYPNYTIYSDGRIFSTFSNKFLKFTKEKTKSGKERYRVGLKKGNGFSKLFLVHQLLGEAFIPNPNNYKIINHKDGDQLNIKLKNPRVVYNCRK